MLTIDGDAVTLYLQSKYWWWKYDDNTDEASDADVYVDPPTEKDNIDFLSILPIKRMETLRARKSGVPHWSVI